MSKEPQPRSSEGQARRVGAPRRWRRMRLENLLLMAMFATGLLLLVAGCGQREPTETPTAVAVAASSTPELVPTWTPTSTEPPTSTSTPVSTSTPLPTSSSTPVPPATATPTESPLPPTATPAPATDTPLPPTSTAAPPTSTAAPPTRTPLPPTATAPPPPRFPWRGQVAGTFPNCSLTRLMGLTLDRNGGIAGDIWVHFWADGWEGGWSQSRWTVDEGYPGMDDSSNWDGVLDTYAKPGTWHVCVVPAQGNGDCISNTVTVQTAAEPCAPESGGIQIVRMVFQLN